MEILYLLAEVIPCLIIGYLLGKYYKSSSQQIANPLINYGIPISLMGILLKVGLSNTLIHSALIALLTIGVQISIIRFIPNFKKDINSLTMQLGSSFGNTGYFGIPISLALLPEQALSYSIGFDLGGTIIIWSVGPLLLKKKPVKENIRLWQHISKVLATSPAIKGLIGALLVQLTPFKEQLTSILWIPSKTIIVLSLLIVGMRLGWLSKPNWKTICSQFKSVKSSLLIKLIGLPALMMIICLILQLPNMIRSALVLQSAMPTAISVLLIAQANNQDGEKATWLVVLTTVSALITIPIWATLLKLA